MTIFIKPNTTNTNTYYIIAVFNEAIPCLENVKFAYDEGEIADFLQHVPFGDDDRIMFDASVYTQTGFEIRDAVDKDIFLYKNNGDPASNQAVKAITVQAKWIADNMTYSIAMKDNPDFQRFLQLIQDYRPNNPNFDSTAAELMADAAKYFRKSYNN